MGVREALSSIKKNLKKTHSSKRGKQAENKNRTGQF